MGSLRGAAGAVSRVELEAREWVKRARAVYSTLGMALVLDEQPGGPWEDEPDEATWVDAVTGLACRAQRGWSGVWCGYVSVPRTHPLHGLSFLHPEVEALDVHGGVTFAAAWLDEGDWWFGFDCGHVGDTAPAAPALTLLSSQLARLMGEAENYRTLAFVRGEVESLARQLQAAR